MGSMVKGDYMRKAAALLSAGLLVVTVACGRNDPDYEDAANKALDQANLPDVDADYNNDERVVHVTGTVSSEADRQRAGDVVQQAVANGAQVANEVTVVGGHTEVADDLDGGLERKLSNTIELDAALKDRDVTFDANNGVVTITGRVASAAEKQRIEQMARGEAGVRDVVNSLEVGEQEAPRNR
jgi:hyperosmotically inducible protein